MSQILKAAGNLVAVLFESAGETIRALSELRHYTAENAADIPVDVEEVAELTFREVVTWITKNHPKDDRVVKAAVLREVGRRGMKVTTVFLDKDGKIVRDENDIPFGRAQRVRDLEKELDDFFGKRDMVLFE